MELYSICGLIWSSCIWSCEIEQVSSMIINWRKISFVSFAVIIILIIALTWKGCGRESKIITVKVPAVQSSFEWQAPTQMLPNNNLPAIPVLKPRPDLKLERYKKESDSLLEAYRSENDSLKQIAMFADAIQIREFKNHFEDEYLSVDVFSRAQGYVKDVRIDYELKERKIQHELESTRLRLLLGGQFGANQDLNSFPYKLDVGFQNAKGHIIEGSYMRLNGENYGLIGGKFSILEVR